MGTPRLSSGGLFLIGASAWAGEATWDQVVQERLSSEAAAIHWQHSTPRAEMPLVPQSATFGPDGVTVSDAAGELLSMSFVRWGRDGHSQAVAVRQARQGTCIAGLQVAMDGRCIRGLERDHGDITEWWVGLQTGLEQGWTINTPPPGEGLIRLETAIDGALLVEASGDQGWLTDAAGQLWQVHTVVAWDATGRALPARIDAEDSRLIVSVDDTDAVWPITVDPVYTTAASVLTGYGTSDNFGYSVSDAGDVNNDGYDDVIVGAPGVYGIGAAYVFEGSAAGVDTDADTSLAGDSIGDTFGWVVSGAGDVNGDGYDDVIVGAPGADTDAGAAYVYEGSSTGILGSTEEIITGVAVGISLGWSVSGAGDIDNDGYDDVIISAPLAGVDGEVYVHDGSAGGVSTTADTTLSTPSGTVLFGWSVSDAGDVNTDGYSDIIVGAADEARVYEGSALGLDTTAAVTLPGSGDFGYTVSGAGDINDDGYDDVIIGAPDTVSAFTYLGSGSGLSSTVNTTLSGTGVDYGISVSGAGDVNGDGYDDVIVGTADNLAYVYTGDTTGIDIGGVTTLTSTDGFGESVSGAGDVNGDGYSDVIVGAYGDNAFTGAAYIFHGYCTDDDADGYCVYEDCDDNDSSFNVELTFYADVDGDGYGDAASTTEDCTPPTGYVTDSTDCDDNEAAANPGETETCDEIDNDCDGDVDEGVLLDWYADNDGDGYGDPDSSVEDCTEPSGYSSDSTDCDDSEAAANPGETEICDEIDNDCDGDVDEDTQSVWYPDTDGDGFGGIANAVDACEPPPGYVADNTDCDDTVATTYPDADDPPNDGVDADCNGIDPSRWVQGGASCATAPGRASQAGLLVLLMMMLRRRSRR